MKIFKEANVGDETVPAPSGAQTEKSRRFWKPHLPGFSHICGRGAGTYIPVFRQGICSSELKCLAQDHKGKHKLQILRTPRVEAVSGGGSEMSREKNKDVSPGNHIDSCICPRVDFIFICLLQFHSIFV